MQQQKLLSFTALSLKPVSAQLEIFLMRVSKLLFCGTQLWKYVNVQYSQMRYPIKQTQHSNKLKEFVNAHNQWVLLIHNYTCQQPGFQQLAHVNVLIQLFLTRPIRYLSFTIRNIVHANVPSPGWQHWETTNSGLPSTLMIASVLAQEECWVTPVPKPCLFLILICRFANALPRFLRTIKPKSDSIMTAP
mgnify:FL=1